MCSVRGAERDCAAPRRVQQHARRRGAPLRQGRRPQREEAPPDLRCTSCAMPFTDMACAARFNGATPLDCSAGEMRVEGSGVRGRKVKQVLEERGAQTAAEMRYRDKCKKNWQSVRHARMLAANEALHHQPGSRGSPK
eukprot:3928679-Rhodomonas_salina.2